MTVSVPPLSPTSLRSIIRPSIKDVRDIFPSATGAGIMLPHIRQGLMIEFNQRAEICSELGIGDPSSFISHRPLFDLTRIFGFVVLRNCSAKRVPVGNASKLSNGLDGDSKFIQDPFHYDVPPNEFILSERDYMSGIYKTSPEARDTDTLMAREADVKDAISKLNVSTLPLIVMEALDAMVAPDYHFRLFHPAENEARQIVKLQYPEFVEDVFALIPQNFKYRQKWLKDQWDILLMSNVFGDWLHARPTGHVVTSHEAAVNPLSGLYLLKGNELFCSPFWLAF